MSLIKRTNIDNSSTLYFNDYKYSVEVVDPLILNSLRINDSIIVRSRIRISDEISSTTPITIKPAIRVVPSDNTIVITIRDKNDTKDLAYFDSNGYLHIDKIKPNSGDTVTVEGKLSVTTSAVFPNISANNVTVNNSITPNANNSGSVGTSSKTFQNVYSTNIHASDFYPLGSSATFHGDLTISGNLTVAGNVTYVESTNMQVKDNIIILNYGETGNGVSQRYSGIEIDRGSAPNVRMVWDESDKKFKFVDINNNLQNLRIKDLYVNGINASIITTHSGAHLGLDNNGGGVLVLANNPNDNAIYLEGFSHDLSGSANFIAITGRFASNIQEIKLKANVTRVYGHIIPSDNKAYSLGDSNHYFKYCFVDEATFNNAYVTGTLQVSEINGFTLSNHIAVKEDNTYQVGDPNHRLKALFVVDLYTGDLKLANGWIISELEDGVVIKDGKGREIFSIKDDGLYFKGRKII